MTRAAEGPRARTLEEVAAAAGVSKSTVSRVINGSSAVSPAARDAVQRTIDRTGYRPNRAARSLVTRRTGSVALIVSEPAGRVFSEPFFAGVVRGMTEVLRERDIQLVLMLADDDRAHRQVLDYLRGGHLDGALLLSSHAADPLPELLVAEGLPAVLSGRPVRPMPISYVDVDGVAGAGLAVAHLADQGRRRIASIAGPPDTAAGQDRLAGYRQALQAAGMTPEPALVGRGSFTWSGGAQAMEQVLAASDGGRPDGLFVASDQMALGALAVLAEHRLRVPEDIAVVGFDDSPAALEARPPLTTVRWPVEQLARGITRILLDRIADPDAPVTARVYPPQLVVRQSS
jgi:DNA-binding LacI/PurR family transcriptional regulator